jgi:hypothetical protein
LGQDRESAFLVRREVTPLDPSAAMQLGLSRQPASALVFEGVGRYARYL